MPGKKWSKTKVLSRKTSFRPIEKEDLRYAWAAYRTGGLKGRFAEGLSASAFAAAFSEIVVSRFDAVWTLFADTQKGYVPAGFVFGFYPHPEALQFLIGNEIVWLPWANARNRVEGASMFFGKVDIPMIFFAKDKDGKFFETLAKIGVVRRVGTSIRVVFPGETASIWETKNGRSTQRT